MEQTPDTTAPPALSIIIPTHDTRELTSKCLESVARQGALDVELIVVDDGSRDDTDRAIAERHPEARVIRRPQASGFSAAANHGLREARGAVLWLLNSDTEVEPEAISRLLEWFRQAPRLGVAGASLICPDGRPQWSAGRAPTMLWLFLLASGGARALSRWPIYRRARAARSGAVDWVSGAAMAIRREAWLELGPLDEGFAFYAQDTDLCLRMRDAGWEVALMDDVRVVHHGGATIGQRSGSASDGQNPALLWPDLLRLFSKRHGPTAARRAARAMRVGVRLRRIARFFLRPFVSSLQRPAFTRDGDALRSAAAAIRGRVR